MSTQALVSSGPESDERKSKRRLPRIYLVRHGETEWSLNGRHTGRSDIPLTDNGVNLLKSNAPKFVGEGKMICPKTVRQIFCSPRQRAKKTLELISDASDVPFLNDPKINVSYTEDVAEWNYGDYEGLTTKQIKARNPNWWIWTDGCPNGESTKEMTDRIDRVIQKILDIHMSYVERLKTDSVPDEEHGADVLIVSHGHFSRCFLVRWAKLEIHSGEILVCDPGCVNIGGYQHHSTKERSLLAQFAFIPALAHLAASN